MHTVFFLGLVFSLSIVTLTAQQVAVVPKLSYQEFYQRLYPLSDAQQFEYQNAARELHTFPTSKPALARLSQFADAGHMPARHDLIEAQFAARDVESSHKLSCKGASQGDPGCAITLATMYMQWSKPKIHADEQELQRCTQLSNAAESLLRAARAKRFIHDPETKKQIATYENEEAKIVLHNYLAEKQTEFEKTLNTQEIKKYEKGFTTSVSDIPLACFVIKENIAKGTHEPIKSALGLAEKILSQEIFDADYLHAAGVRCAIEKLKDHENTKIKERAAKICNLWNDVESRVGTFQLAPSIVPRDTKKRFVTPDYSPETLSALIEHGASIYEGQDLVDAAVYLNLHREKDERVDQAVKDCLTRALQDPSPFVKQAIIEQCTDNLSIFAHQAMQTYAQELKNKSGLLSQEVDFMNRQLQKTRDKADNGDDQAAIHIYTWLSKFPEVFTAVSVQQVESLRTEYFKKALTAGNWDAICSCLPKMRAMQPQTSEQLARAMKFWSKAYTSSADLLASSPDVVEFAALHAEAFDRLINLLSLKTETGTTIHDAEFYYHAATAFAHNDGIASLKAFQNAVQVVFLTHGDGEAKQQLYQTTGMKAVLEREAVRGQGWAYFAQAYYTFLAALNPGYAIDSRTHAQLTIQAIEQARTLLQSAATAQVPHTDFSKLDEVDLDVKKAATYYEIYKIDSNQLYLAKALELLELTIQKKSATGMYNWAMIAINGHTQKGQSVLEQSIEYLIQSTHGGCTSAENFLKEISAKGFLFVAGCGGIITTELKNKIDACLNVRMQRNGEAAQIPPSVIGVMNPAEEYQLIKDKADQGNIQAMVTEALYLKEGLGVERSLSRAQARFADALLAWQGQKLVSDEIAIAYNALTEVAATDVRAQVARCKANMYTLINVYNPESDCLNKVIEDTFKELKNMQRLMKESGNTADRQLFYSSGLATLIEKCLIKCCESPLQRFKLLEFYMHDALWFSHEISNSDNCNYLLTCINEIINKIEGFFVFPEIPIRVTMCERDAFQAAYRSLLDLLAAQVLPEYCEKLLYLKALLMAYDSVIESLENPTKDRATKPFSSQTIMQFEELSKKGNLDARYMYAYIATHGHTICLKNQHQPTKGMALFEELAEKKHVKSLIVLVNIAKKLKTSKPKEIMQNNKKIERYLKTILEVEPRNSWAISELVALYKAYPELKAAEQKKQ